MLGELCVHAFRMPFRERPVEHPYLLASFIAMTNAPFDVSTHVDLFDDDASEVVKAWVYGCMHDYELSTGLSCFRSSVSP